MELIATIFDWGGRIVGPLWKWVSRYKPKVPRETLRFVSHPQASQWNPGTVKGQPAMQVHSKWYATNITDHNVLLLSVRLRKPAVNGSVCVQHPHSNYFGNYPILPGATTEAIADFWITPPLCKPGEDYKADLIFIDQFGNDHKVNGVCFVGQQPSPPQRENPGEIVHAITDPIEKAVVSVLKSEVQHYKTCGRRSGGLGSVQVVIDGKYYAGVGADWRDADSPKNQSLTPDPAKAAIVSDNVDALVKFFASLKSEKEKAKFVKALLKRLLKDSEYASIGYFIMFVLYRIGKLDEALSKAKRDLAGDSAYGFSDLLRLLDGFLRIEHPSFSVELLDIVDRFINGVNEHTFAIQERMAAIRTKLLTNS